MPGNVSSTVEGLGPSLRKTGERPEKQSVAFTQKERKTEEGLHICIPRAAPLINIGRRTAVARGEGAKWYV